MKEKHQTNTADGQSRRVLRVCRLCSAAQGTGTEEGRAVSHRAHTVKNGSITGRALKMPNTAGTGWI